MNEKELVKLLDIEPLKLLNGIKAMLSKYDLRLEIIPSDYEDEYNVFYFGVTGKGKDSTLVFYREEFVLDDDVDYNDLTEDFAVAFYELFSTVDLMKFVISTLDKVRRTKGIKFTDVALTSYDVSRIQITSRITDEYYGELGECLFTVNMERRGVDIEIYTDKFEIYTSSIELTNIDKDVKVELNPIEKLDEYNGGLPLRFSFNVKLEAKKIFDGLGKDYVRRATKLLRNFGNVYNMLNNK
jgi:hypothetical protein